ncbi:hypothetical protein B0J11DRAFT_135481 [Dendryphion nanum]|uniref:Uncharacterized protein n=1 Tax=Dendryphion nanum TaxID=256645 RepID=A0A9P9D8Q8_9PLEO|nr:hypothetical protein B0J11DRAFT_135481 [Dendryphion nanum]
MQDALPSLALTCLAGPFQTLAFMMQRSVSQSVSQSITMLANPTISLLFPARPSPLRAFGCGYLSFASKCLSKQTAHAYPALCLLFGPLVDSAILERAKKVNLS